MDPGFADALAITGFRHRATFQEDGWVVYRLADGSRHVRLTRAAWDGLGQEFKADMRSVRRRTIWLSIGLLPGIMLFAMTIGQFLPFTGLLILVAFFGGPIAIYLRHSAGVQRVAAGIEAKLAACDAGARPRRDVRRVPRWLEIALLLMVGPSLLIAVAGEIGGPDTFRGTPLMGTGIGKFEIIAFLLIALRLAWPHLAPRLARRA